MKRKKHILILLVMVLSLVLATPAVAKGEYGPLLDDKVILGGTFSLREGEVLDGNLVVIGGVVSLAKDSVVRGDVVAIGSNVTSEGEVTGNLVGIGGVINLKETAVVNGDVVAPASVLQREEGAVVYGQIISSSGPITVSGVEIPSTPVVPEAPRIEFGENNFDFEPSPRFIDRITYAVSPIVQFMWFMFRVFILSAIAVVLILFVPEHAKKTSNAIVNQPVTAGGLGLLTLVIVGPLIVLFAITVILIPVSLLIVFVIGLGLFFGWVAIGQEIGRRMGFSLGQDWSDPIQAGLGTFVLTFVISSFNFVFLDVIGWMLGITVAAVGLGAVLLTRFGTRDYVGRPVQAAVEPVEEVSELPEPEVVETKVSKPKASTKAAAKKKTPTKKTTTRKTATKKTPTKKASTRKKKEDAADES